MQYALQVYGYFFMRICFLHPSDKCMHEMSTQTPSSAFVSLWGHLFWMTGSSCLSLLSIFEGQQVSLDLTKDKKDKEKKGSMKK